MRQSALVKDYLDLDTWINSIHLRMSKSFLFESRILLLIVEYSKPECVFCTICCKRLCHKNDVNKLCTNLNLSK